MTLWSILRCRATYRLCRRWPRRILMCLKKVYHRWITNNFPSKWHKHSKWLQILAQEDFPPKLLRSENADFKFSVNNEGEDVKKKPRSRENIAWHSEGNADNKRQEREIGIRGIMIVLHCGKPRFLSLPVSSPIYWSKSAKFQLCITARSIIIFRRTALPFCLFLNPEAEIMLNLLFNTLFTITPHNTQKRRRRKERTT